MSSPTNVENEHLKKLIEQAVQLEEQDPVQLEKIVEEGLALAIEAKQEDAMLQFQQWQGVVFYNRGQYSKAIETFEQVFKASKNRLDDVFNVKVCLRTGASYKFLENYKGAILWYVRALKYDLPLFNASIYDNLASIYFLQKDIKKALSYLQESIAVVTSLQNFRAMAGGFVNISILQCENKDFEAARASCQRALELAQDHHFPRVEVYAYLNMGNAYSYENDPSNARQCYEQALAVAQNHHFDSDSLAVKRRIAALLEQTKQLETAAKVYMDILEYAEQQNLEAVLYQTLPLAILCYENLEDFKNAFFLQKRLIQLHEKTIEQERDENVKKLLEEKHSEISVLIQKNQHIEQQNQILSEFAYIVAHDLKEPLRNITSFTNLLQRRYGQHLDEQAQEYMDFIVRGTKNMNNLLSDLTEYVRLGQIGHFTMTNIRLLVEEVLFNLQNAIERQQATVFNLLPNVSISIAPPQIALLFQNLIQNALKFSKPDTPPIVTVALEEKENRYIFSIQDNGIGIERQYQEQIFKIFTRLKKGEYEGTGIGLAICKRVILAHQGKIWVESELNQGTTFFFSIPK